MMGDIKQLMKLQQQAKQIQSKLENLHIESEVNGCTVTIDAAMNIIDMQISDEAWTQGKKVAETSIKEATQKAMKKAQQVAAENMKDVMGGLGLPNIG
ncbi:MAG: YbaB/EbfC family nucleoid-associated protein [Candidatus Gracilibacteria bacterium]